MADLANLQVTIDLSDVDPDLEAEALEELTRNLKQEISELVEDVDLVRESNIPHFCERTYYWRRGNS